MAWWSVRPECRQRRTNVLRHSNRPGQTRREAGTQSQGSFVGRPPGCRSSDEDLGDSKESEVKAILARFTGVLAILASLALTIGAGYRWL